MIIIKGVKILVTISGQGKPLLCLHGWGGSHESFTQLRDTLQGDAFKIIAPDLPGFGESSEPPLPWGVDEYADFVESLVKSEELNLNNQKILILGHSFGGRIGIKLASRGCPWIEHLYLCASAGLRQKRYWKREVAHFLAKKGKRLLEIFKLGALEHVIRRAFQKLFRAYDYSQASPLMKESMIKTINEDLFPLLDQVHIPTDLFWGEDDKITPLSDGHLMNKKIVHSVLHTFKNVRHGVHRDSAEEIGSVIRGDYVMVL